MSDTSLTCETTTLKNRLCIYDLVLNWFLPKKNKNYRAANLGALMLPMHYRFSILSIKVG